MTVDDDAAAKARAAKDDDLDQTNDRPAYRESTDSHGLLCLLATSKRGQRSLFANVHGTIDSDSLVHGRERFSLYVKAWLWAARTINDDVDEKQSGYEEFGYVQTFLLDVLDDWISDLDEVGYLAQQLHCIRLNRGDLR